MFAAESLQLLANVAVGVGPTHVAGGDGRFYLADTQGNAILMYSTAPSAHLLASIAAAGAPYGLAL